jgi:hypothetical protein
LSKQKAARLCVVGFPVRSSLEAVNASPKSRSPIATGRRFAVCVDNDGCEVLLERNKIYVVLPDRNAERDGDRRVVDESGEDYVFSADRFVIIDVPDAVRVSLLRSSR